MAVGVGAVVLSMVVNPISVFVLERLGYSTESTVQQPFMEGLVGWVQREPWRGHTGDSPGRRTLRSGRGGTGLQGRRLQRPLPAGDPYLHQIRWDGHPKPSSKMIFRLSALASSVLFALLHLEPVLLPVLLILAITLCALFQRTGSLLPSFVAHATFNSFAAMLIILSGLNVLNIPI